MPRARSIIFLSVGALLVALAVVLGSFMPPEFLGGFNRPIAVTLIGIAPVLLVAVAVGCVLAYRWARQAFGSYRSDRKWPRKGKSREL